MLLETEEKQMNTYVQQNCTIHGVHYPHQKLHDITYKTGARVCRVSNITEHFTKADHIFGRGVKIIYDGQPNQKRHATDDIEDDQEQMETHNESDTNNSPTTVQKTPHSQMPEGPNTQTTTTEQPEISNSPTISTETSLEELPTTTENTTETTPHPIMELTIDEFPTLPFKTPTSKSDTQETPDIADFSDDSMEPLLAITNKPIQTIFKQPTRNNL